MNIALIEPFYGGSHKQWCDGFKSHSTHTLTIFSLSAHHWKWRMQGGAIALAKQFLACNESFDLIIASDFLNLPLFKSLISAKWQGPICLYFHENQITYPWSPDDQDIKLNRDHSYGFINYTSALIADRIFFNSKYHLNSFNSALPRFIGQFPDHNDAESIESILQKSEVLYLGMDYSIFDKSEAIQKSGPPIILWNHRWEYDKNPEEFFDILFQLKAKNIIFKLIVLGKQNTRSPKIFNKAYQHLHEEIIHWGYAKSRQEYAELLQLADIIPITSNQDFFGISLVEALYCNSYPILPRRLAYSEHFEDTTSEYFYLNRDECLSKLVDACTNIQSIRNRPILHDVHRYRWSTLIRQYDDVFFSLI